MKLLGYNTILCLSPHPDDLEYSMSGTIMKYPDTKFISLQMCQGGDIDVTTGVHRLQEVSDAWNHMACDNCKLRFTDFKLMRELREEEWVNYIEKIMEELNPDALVLPNNYDSHFEHRFVSGLGKAVIRSNPKTLIQYKTPSTGQEWIPNLFIDINEQYQRKTESLKMFKSQQHRYYFREDVIRAFHSDFESAKKGKHYVEQFKILELYI